MLLVIVREDKLGDICLRKDKKLPVCNDAELVKTEMNRFGRRSLCPLKVRLCCTWLIAAYVKGNNQILYMLKGTSLDLWHLEVDRLWYEDLCHVTVGQMFKQLEEIVMAKDIKETFFSQVQCLIFITIFCVYGLCHIVPVLLLIINVAKQ